MNKVAAFALRRKNRILSMSEKMFCPPQPLRFWITPACAGKSMAQLGPCGVGGDHPRMCGEKICVKLSLKSLFGSPPRMRGKAPINRHQAEEHGVTPACAGKSAGTGSRSGASWDHPRVCGEKHSAMVASLQIKGSPPRVRGKVPGEGFLSQHQRITPACAGKSGGLPCRVHRRGDHPRLCGEKSA